MTEFICKKCDELKAYNVVATADVNPEVVDSLGCTEWAGYDKDEVDAVIAELKAENSKLKRALWLARAERAFAERRRYCAMAAFEKIENDALRIKWCKIQHKSIKKAEEYK